MQAHLFAFISEAHFDLQGTGTCQPAHNSSIIDPKWVTIMKEIFVLYLYVHYLAFLIVKKMKKKAVLSCLVASPHHYSLYAVICSTILQADDSTHGLLASSSH